mgnify:CR=1 FL=1
MLQWLRYAVITYNKQEKKQEKIELRKQLKYPPFCDIILLLISGETEEFVKNDINKRGYDMDFEEIYNEDGLDYLDYIEYIHDNNLQELRRCVQKFRDSK